MRRLLLALLLALVASAARAQPLAVPGLSADSQHYQALLRRPYPAGAAPGVLFAAETRAREAERAGDWAQAVAAWEQRVGGDPRAAGPWLALARDRMRLAPPTPRRALEAAYAAYQRTRLGPQQNPALAVMAAALERLGHGAPELAVRAAMLARDPHNAALATALATRRAALGLLVAAIHTYPEAFPARACLGFTVAPGGRADFQPADWVRLSPAPRSFSVTLDQGEICIAGLPPGATTRVMLRAGMPGAGGIALHRATTLAIAMPNRKPRLVFDNARYLLPRSQKAAVVLSSVNLSRVKLTVVRIAERNVIGFLSSHAPGDKLYSWSARHIPRQDGRLVWQGHADLRGFRPNRLVRSVLALPKAVLAARPGLYALIALADDGTPFSYNRPAALQLILRTDLAPTAWRGADGLSVQVRSYATALPKAGARVALLAANNEVLATATTGTGGVVHFAAPLLAGGGGMAPREIHIRGKGGDFTLLRLDRAGFDLSGRGVSGRPQPGPLDGFVWFDRGIYRPGETVHVSALLRDGAGAPVDVPVHLLVRRPNGQVFLDTVPPRGPGASLAVPIALPEGAQSGHWTVTLKTDPKGPAIGAGGFQVEAFVPARLRVTLGKPSAPPAAGTRVLLPVGAEFLYGAPGSRLSGQAELRFAIDRAPFPAYAHYRFGLAGEVFAPDLRTLPLPETDTAGHSRLALDLTHLPDSTHPLAAQIVVTVDDPAGRAVSAATTLPIRGRGPLIGIRPLFKGGAVDANQRAGFAIVALDPAGHPIGLAARLRLIRQTPDWHLVVRHGLARYETVWRDRTVENTPVEIAPGTPFRYARALPFGRYKLEVVQSGNGLAATSVVFYSGWASAPGANVPEKVALAADRASYAPGETATIHVAAPFAGPATLLVLTNKVLEMKNIDVPAAGRDVAVPVAASWGPGAYVAVEVFRPAGERSVALPRRALGLTWVAVDRAARTLPLTLALPARFRPRRQVRFTVRTAPGAVVSLAAVDEGVLGLTGFANPDPVGHYLGRRTLGVSIRDGWGRLIPPAAGLAAVLQQGGGGNMEHFFPSHIPQRIVSLFVPPLLADASGRATVTLTLPDFNGQLRVMAVAWKGDKFGQAHGDVLVRDRLIAEPLLPRFLAPGDQARLAVLVQDLSLPAGTVALHLAVSGPLALAGPTTLTLDLAPGKRALPFTTLDATGYGIGTLTLTATGPGGFRVTHRARILVHPVAAPVTRVATGTVSPGAVATLVPPVAGLLAGTWRARLLLGGAVAYDPAALMEALDAYPLRCLEQITSRAFPLALLPPGPLAGADRAGRLERAVEGVLDRQRFDGGFGLWSSEDPAEPWLSAYATEFLLRARAAGVPVPAPALAAALAYLAGEIATPAGHPAGVAARAYAAYVLTLADRAPAGAIRLMAAHPDRLPTPLARAEVGAALARLDQPTRARALFAAASGAPGRNFWYADYGSGLRDRFATLVLAKESGVMAGRIAPLIARLPGADLAPDALSTQEQSWGVAAAAVLGSGTALVRARLGGQDLPHRPSLLRPLAGESRLTNLGKAPLVWRVSARGIPAAPPPAAQSGMRIFRAFYDLSGQPLAVGRLRQNTVFVMFLTGGAFGRETHQAMLTAGLPAGWEIAGTLPGGRVPGMAWLGKLTGPVARAAADDRFAVALDLGGQNPEDFRVAVLLRAVTPGSYGLPGAGIADMYRPGVRAQEKAGRVAVLPAR